MPPAFGGREPLTRMADGTVKQFNPFTGTDVWTVPGRAQRPLGVTPTDAHPLSPGEHRRLCAFCPDNRALSTPDKARVVHDHSGWHTLTDANPPRMDQRMDQFTDRSTARVASRPASESTTSVAPAEFRRIANLFEIVGLDYWRANYAYEPPQDTLDQLDAYLAIPDGRAHLEHVVRTKLRAAGRADEAETPLSPDTLRERALPFFAGGHDVIVARRHVTDDATTTAQLASSGTLTPEEHYRFTALTVRTAESLYRQIRYARYVSVFQNWLGPAGASFDHLHKQVVAIDEHSTQTATETALLRANLNAYNDLAAGYAARHNLLVAENDHAVAFAGFGHRWPTLEVFSRSRACFPWEHSEEEVRGVSDLLHGLHAATGADVPVNEEWHHRPPDLDLPMPWRIMLKWRVSNLAGFEGGTKIYINTLTPWNIRDKVVPRLHELRDTGLLAQGLRVGEECEHRPNSLLYNPMLHALH